MSGEAANPVVHFLGGILPEAFQISVGHKPVVKWEASEVGLSMEFTINIEHSQIDVECKLNRYTPDDLTTIYMRALDLVRASVNLVAFASGHGVTVYLHTFVAPDGATSSIAPIDPSLSSLCTAFKLDQGFDEVHALALQEVGLFMALNDLIAAITLPHVAPVNCARAMDGLKHLIATPGAKDGEAWRQMREALQIDLPYLKFITDHSAGPRHARPGHTPGTVTSEVARRSWVIMNRYFEYRKGGSKKLLSRSFPLLVA